MTSLLELREKIRNIYSKYEIYLTPFFKFLLALITFIIINSNVGYMSKLTNAVIVIVLALMCSFLPTNGIALISGGLVCVHFYTLSLECGVVAFGLFLLMFLLYFRFAPKDILVILLLPICYVLKIPYVIPIAVALLCTPTSIISVSCGTLTFYMMDYIKDNNTVINTLETDGAAGKFRFIIDGIWGNKEMLIMLISFAIMIVIVYFIRRMSMDHAWTIATIVGAVVGTVFILVGELILNVGTSIVWLIIGMILSILLEEVLKFFAFNVDYSRTEYVQFEDDEYYYYVKAIPKNSLAASQKTVKKITSVL